MKMCKECEEKKVNEQFKKYEGIKGANTLVKGIGDKPYVNIKGQKYGKLTAIEPAGRNKEGRLLWLFKCDCSNYVITIPKDVMRSHTTTCGCSWKEKGKKIEVGQRFGKLVTVENMGVINGKTVWRCICDCNNEVFVTTSNLNAGTSSCGCLRKEVKHNIKDLTGEEINGWKVIKRVEDRVRPSGERLTMWLCKCVKCGKEEIISRESLREYPKVCECSKVHKVPRNIEKKNKNSCKRVSKKVLKDLTGQTFNYLTVLEELGGSKVKVRCKCGTEKIVDKKSMKYGSVKSCGCLSKKRKYENLEGKVFTRWTVIKDEGEDKVLCKCSCGTERWVSRGNLRGCGSTSCGCLRKEVLHEKYKKVEIGQVYGRLTIRKCLGRNHNKKLIWEAECSCGNVVTVTSDLIRNGNTRSCGCLKKEQTKERCTKPMIGKTFGRLKVIRLHHNEKGHNFYECLCSCGNTSIVDGTWLRSGNTTSCGCYARERSQEYEDLSGRRFGKLVVLRRVPNRGRGHGTRFLCKCDCGGLTETARHSLLCGETVSCGCINSKGELKISQILNENNIIFERQKTYDDLRIGKHGIPKFDFYVPEGNYIIEYDGQQHFIYTNLGWNDEEHFKKVQERDKLKNEYCKKNNIPIIRVPYTKYDTLCLEDLLLETSEFVLKE